MTNDKVHKLLKEAYPDFSEEELTQARLDLETLCRVVWEKRELLRPLLVLKRAEGASDLGVAKKGSAEHTLSA